MKQAIAIPVPAPQAVSVLGVPVVPFESYEQAVRYVAEAVEKQTPSFWVAVNPQKVHRALHDPELMEVLRQADAGICDGVGVSLASRILNGRSIPRCTGCDLFLKLIELAAERGWGVFLLGASPQSNQGAAQKLQERYPGLRIVGRQDGFFKDDQAVIRQINDSGADLLFVAMGTPRQEKWIRRHRGQIQASFCMGVGGSFDVASGTARRAPKLMQWMGTEFLYQLVTQPGRWKRQIVYFPFVARVIGQRLARIFHKETPTA